MSNIVMARIYLCVILAMALVTIGSSASEPAVGACPSQEPMLLNRAKQPRVLMGRELTRRVVSCVAPKFPAMYRSLRLETSAQVRILVDEYGHISCVNLIRGNPLVVGSALDAAKQWTFYAMTQHGQPVSFYGILAFCFSANRNGARHDSCLEARW